MKKHFKRWIAFLLAVVLVTTTCLFSSDSFLRASEDGEAAKESVEETMETQELIVPQPEEPVQEPAPAEEEPAPVQEPAEETQPVQPEEPAGDMPTGDEIEVTPETPAAEETIVPTPEPAVEETVVPTQEPAAEEPAATEEPAPTSTPAATPEMPAATQTPTASASPTPTATPDGEEETKSFGYEIRYYYDGVEDEESRVVKEDGMPDEPILDADTVKEKLIRDGKEYTLDKIVNKNGKITENAEDNVVEVYYVSAGEEKPETTKAYSLKFKTVPSEGGRVEVISPKAEETDTSNTYKGDTEVTFEVSAKEGYELLSVENQDEEELKADSEEEGISTYAVTMTEDMVVTVTFEEVKEEVKMPAQTFETSAGGISITISAPEGVLPEGTTVKAENVGVEAVAGQILMALAMEEMSPVEIAAVDITLTDKEGSPVIPEGSLTVKMENVFDNSISATSAAVYHVSGDGASKVSDADPDASGVEFTTDHFSVYAAVKSEEDVAVLADEIKYKQTYNLVEGEKVELDITDLNKWNQNHKYNVESSTIAKVTSQSRKVWIEALKAGETTVEHTWKNGTEYFKIIVSARTYTVRFNLNGGKGTLPQEISGETGTIIELPSGEGISRDGYKLLGWSESQDANTVSEGSAAAIYNLGSEYEITSDKTLYAIWAQESGDKIGKIQAAIRKDGTVPDEPSIQNADYSYFDLLTDVNVLEYFSPAHTVSGSIVNSRLTDKFKNWIEGQNNQKGFWDTETQYVEWYVIKYQGNDSRWHIDGVVRDKEKVNLTYDRNGATGGLVPDSNQYSVGSTVKVAGNPYSLAKMGYNWVGWNTKADGTGTTYTEGNEITLNESVTLYAKWEAKNSTKYRVEHYKQNLNGDGYDLAETEELSGRTDSIANAIPKTTYTGFEYDADTSAETKSGIITADEELVLKLYYNRSGYAITYIWAEDTAQIVKDNRSVPQDNNTYLYESPFTADDTEYEAVETYDNYNNVTGRYTFAGWNPQNGIVTDHLTIVGTWEYTPVDVIKHTVTYNWTGLPDATLYDANGREIPVPHCPVDDGKYVNGQSYTVDGAKYSDVYTKDAFGNLNAKYTLGEWDKTGEQIMGESDVTISAEWKCEKILVSTWTITYEWDGDEPTGKYTQVKPTDPKTYTNNESYTVDTKYGKDYTFNTTDEYGNVNGAYTFSGWDTENGNITSDLTITGTWSFEETTVAKHNAVYGWSGLPNEQLYDAAGNAVQRPAKPEGHMGLVKGQGYTVDGTRYGDVYTKDAFGNLNAKYTLGEWNDPNGGVMGESNVTISAQWKSEKILVPTWKIKYEWSGDVPIGSYTQTEPTDSKTYINNESYTVDTKYGKGYTFNTTDKYGNINGAYTFSGWDTENGNITSDLTITGKWTFRETTVATHNVVYSWSDLPDAQLYDAAGNAVQRPTKPEGHMGLVKGQSYTVNSAKYSDVYTKDAFGNLNAKYTLGEWNDPNGGVMGESDVTISARWNSETIPVSTWTITYEWDGDEPTGSYTQVKPTDPKTYTNNESYTADTKYVDGYTFNTTDEYGNINGAYTFSGWSPKKGNITSNLTITGTWSFEETTVAKHNSVYGWSGLPNEQLYDAAGNAVQRPAKPEGHMGLVKGQGYTVDGTRYGDVYTKDAFGNLNAKYTLGEWNDPNGGVMGESDVTISAQWKSEKIPVPTWKIKYEWSGDVPTGSYTQTEPTDGKIYTNNESYTVDETFEEGYTFNTTDEYGNINGAYTFIGWDTENGNITSDLTITGKWIFRETTVATHNAVYSWSGLPDAQLYDAAGNAVQRPAKPEGHMGLVKGQGYTVDSAKYSNVYTKDAFGNLNAKYTLGEWNDPNGGVMGGSDVTISAVWILEDITVPQYAVTYKYNGNVPTGEIPPEDEIYYVNQPVTLAEEPSHEGYVFKGWDRADGFRMPNSPVEITGTWEVDFSDITAGKIMEIYSGETYTIPLDGILSGDQAEFFVNGEKVDNSFKDVTDQTVTVRITRGTDVFEENIAVRIDPRTVLLKSADRTERYTGNEYDMPELVEETGWVESEKVNIAYDFTGKQKWVGKSDNTFTAVSTNNEKVKLANYNIQYEYGILTVTDGSTEEPIGPDGVVTKTHDDREYRRGDTITFTITAVNIYNEAKTITITEQAGVTITGDSVFENVQPGDMVETTATYEVTDADIVRGSFSNTVSVSYSGGTTIDQTDVVDDIEEPNGHLTLTKETTSTPANGAAYALGETITYEIRALNDGNLTLTDVVVTDDLTGDSWTISEISPGQRSTAMMTSYTVTEADILAGSVVNVVTASGTSPDPDEPDVPVTPGMEEDPTSVPEPSLFAEKTASASVDGGTYGLGEEVTYTIRIVNNGNVTISNIEVKDDLTGDSWTTANLAPGESGSFEAVYTVTEDDIRAGRILNVASASGTAPDGNPVDAAAEEEIFTDALDGSVNVVKTVTNPRTQYNVGDVINYQITVTNTGNVTLHNVRVEDVLNGTEGSVTFTDLAGGILENSTVVLPELAVGETANLRCEYTVARGDANASIGNRVEVTSDEGDDPSDDETDVTPVENIYNLTIHYVYADGTTAAPDVTAQYLEGESFSYTSPTIEGYTPNFLFLRTDVQGMPAKDVELTVVYTANPAVVTPPADDTPPAPPADDTPADDTPPAPPTAPVVPPADDTPVVPPAPPAPPAVPVVPADPVAPVVPAPDDGLVAVEEEPVPTGGAVVADDDGNLTILPVEDEEVPLTNRQLDDHSCCILSFLLMLAAMIVYTCYTSSMKKRQKKIAKLRDQYEAEILRRELGLPSENNR